MCRSNATRHLSAAAGRKALVLAAALLAVGGCSTPAPVASESRALAVVPTLDENLTILILRPMMTVENSEDEQPMDASHYNVGAVEVHVQAAAEHVLRDRGAATVRPDVLKNIMESDLSPALRKIMPLVAKGNVNKKSGAVLESLAPYDVNMAVFANYVRVKIGTAGTWDPNTGAITSANSASMFYSAVIRCATGEVLWESEVLLREAPEVSNKRFTEALELLFRDFPSTEDIL